LYRPVAAAPAPICFTASSIAGNRIAGPGVLPNGIAREVSVRQENPVNMIKRYLQDAIAAERSFELQFRSFANDTRQSDLKDLFLHHADETRRHGERLTARLQALDGRPSTVQGAIARFFGFSARTFQLRHSAVERTAQNLIIAHAIHNAGIAMYEELATVTAAAGDTITQRLAREMQEDARRASQKIWDRLVPATLTVFEELTVNRKAA
jgi:ferritin-like metal-binding protein YciE